MCSSISSKKKREEKKNKPNQTKKCQLTMTQTNKSLPPQAGYVVFDSISQ